MQKLRFTKAALKGHRDDLRRYERYLPTLRIKKQQLQQSIARAEGAIHRTRAESAALHARVEGWVELLAEDVGLESLLVLERIEILWRNVAGVEVPTFVDAHVRMDRYDLAMTPPWVDHALVALRIAIRLAAQAAVLREQKRRLQRELRTTAQRVNLLEQIKIPEKQRSIRRITVHLGDQQTAAFGWALLAKRKAAGAGKRPP